MNYFDPVLAISVNDDGQQNTENKYRFDFNHNKIVAIYINKI